MRAKRLFACVMICVCVSLVSRPAFAATRAELEQLVWQIKNGGMTPINSLDYGSLSSSLAAQAALRVNHIGSTAVSCLIAKPTVFIEKYTQLARVELERRYL
jgi:hypothetical protein